MTRYRRGRRNQVRTADRRAWRPPGRRGPADAYEVFLRIRTRLFQARAWRRRCRRASLTECVPFSRAGQDVRLAARWLRCRHAGRDRRPRTGRCLLNNTAGHWRPASSLDTADQATRLLSPFRSVRLERATGAKRRPHAAVSEPAQSAGFVAANGVLIVTERRSQVASPGDR